MWHSQHSCVILSSFSIPLNPHRMQIARKLLAIFCWTMFVFLLGACGSSAPAGSNSAPTRASTPPAKPTPTVAPTHAAKPTPTHVPPTPIPTKPPVAPTSPASSYASSSSAASAQPPILDVAPASMSIVGHLDCSKTASVFVCQAAVISRASNQGVLHWVAFANIGGVSFSPAQGNLSPGTRVILTIRIPLQECAGTFFFQGPINTHTIGWQC